MKKVLKWFGIVLGVLIVLLIVVAGSLYFLGSSQMAKTYNVQPASVSIPNDMESIERGKYIFSVSCAGCHGDNLAGKVILDDPAIGFLSASNLTSGVGGIGSTYRDIDYVRSIRHGVDPDGKGLIIMPAKAYWHFSSEDLGAIIAYIQSAPAVDNILGENSFTPLSHIMLGAGAFGDAYAAAVLDHEAPLPVAPTHEVTVDYGKYLVDTGDCAACHGNNLAGAQSPEPGSPLSSNLTPGGVLAIWTADDFIKTMRTGVTPYGKQLDGNFMPYESYARLTNEDLTAIFQYLQSLPAIETASK